MTRGKRWGLLALGAAGILAAFASFWPSRPVFIWNFSASAPTGLYRVLDRPWRKGDWVAVRASPAINAQRKLFHAGDPDHVLLKRVAGVQGDVICRSGGIVTINGRSVVRATLQSAGQRLPRWSGCQQLTQQQVFLLGLTDRSFDGRYFGPTSIGAVQYAVSR